MSYKNLIKALSESKSKPFYRVYGVSEDYVINNAGKILGLELSNQHKTFLKEVGNLSFSGFEFYGICNPKFNGKSVPCSIEMTLKERKLFNLPHFYVLFCFFDDGFYAYLDYGNLNSDGEPPLVILGQGGQNTQVIKKVSDDLGDYIYTCVNNSN